MINLDLEKAGFSKEDISVITELDSKYGKRIVKLVKSYLSNTKESFLLPYEGDQREKSYERAQQFSRDVHKELPEVDEYCARLLGWLSCLDYLKESFEKHGIGEDLFYEAIKDFSYKAKECKDVYGSLGLFTDWFFLFFDLKLFSLGRLQYEITSFIHQDYCCGDVTVKKGDIVYYCHIPSSGKLTEEMCMESFQRAYEFFKPWLSGDVIPIISQTWLLYQPYVDRVFSDGSNLKRFAQLFDIIHTSSTCDFFEDAWRVFGKEYKGTVEGLPSDNTLRRSFIEYIKNGGDFGEGYGIILYNGETRKIINRTHSKTTNI